jgi:hypothetical protein|tara:strand:- start:20 stop:820 length:801 start_codon:yes stop_codon:yes gene_type:complete
MGVFQNNLLAGAAAAATAGGGAFYDYQIEQSVRFDSADSCYMNKTFGSEGNRRTGTFSVWVKRITFGTQHLIMNAHINNGDQDQLLGFTSNDFPHVWMDGGTYGYQVADGVYRDASGWGHFVVAWDSTQSTNTDRIKFYLNGNRLTTANDSPTWPSLNREFFMFDNVEHAIGRRTAYSGQHYFDGYLAELIAVDGTAYAPTQFGETKNGVWIPKDPTGTSFGTNGFHLKFENASDLGNDSSGNNHDFTANNFDPDHQVVDSPTFGS